MNCVACGYANEEGATFCRACGMSADEANGQNSLPQVTAPVQDDSATVPQNEVPAEPAVLQSAPTAETALLHNVPDAAPFSAVAQQTEKKKLPAWAIALIAVGVTLFLLICCFFGSALVVGTLEAITGTEIVSSSDSGSQQQDDVSADADLWARPHHYDFAHTVLPGLFFDDPQDLVETLTELSDVDSPNALQVVWDGVVAERVSEADILSSDGLSYEVIEFGDVITMIVITMPPVERVTEACYIAMVYDWQTEEANYFVLEYSFEGETMFCAWFSNGSRANYGPGTPAGDKDAFIEQVVEHLGG